MRLVFIISLIYGVQFSSFSQARIEFEKAVHDFGRIKETDGNAEYTFVFKNVGDKPLQILNVNASCGCTTPSWTKEIVEPGNGGFITASYNTVNRPGTFHKTLQVTTNGEPSSFTLSIQGDVEPRLRSIEELLPFQYGAMRTKFKAFNMGRVTTQKPLVRVFEVYNDADADLKFEPSKTQIPAYLGVAFSPDILPAKSKGEIVVTYDAMKKGKLGYQSDTIVIATNDSTDQGLKRIPIVATIEEYFPPMSAEELANAPRIVLSKALHDFGKVMHGTTTETTILIKNEGASELKLRDLQPNCPCVQVSADNMSVAAGGVITLKVSFDTQGRRGRQYKNVSLFSNDPKQPTLVLNLKADVSN